MKKYLILTLFYCSLGMAQESNIMSKDQVNPDADVSKPTMVVDEFGNVSYKYPKGSNKPAPVPEIKPKPKPSFIKAKDVGHSIEAGFSSFGSLLGAQAGYTYESGHMGFGADVRFLSHELQTTGETFDLLMGNVRVNYHFFPRWYRQTKSRKILDPEIFATLGYGSGESDLSNKTQRVIIGIGAKVSYPIFEDWSVTLGLEQMQSLSGGSGSLGATGTFGVRYSWD